MNNMYVVIVLFSVLVGLLSVGAFLSIEKLVLGYRRYKYLKESKAKYDRLQKAKDDMIARGETHEWVEFTYMNGQRIMVCKKSGWSPTLNGFLDLKVVGQYLQAENEVKRITKEYEDFLSEKLVSLSKQYDIEVSVLRKILKDIEDGYNQMTQETIQKQYREWSQNHKAGNA